MGIFMKKTENIILRVSSDEHSLIKIKSEINNKSKSRYIVDSAISNDLDKISISKILDLYQESTDEYKNQIIDMLFLYYRRKGFPYTKLSDVEKKSKIKSVINSNVLVNDNEFKLNVNGISLANSFHPHMEEAKYSDKMSPFEAYDDDFKFKDCIKRWLDLGKKPSRSGLRSILRTRNGVRGVGNFRPTIAKYFYDNYCSVNGLTLDPCSGFSGRLVGAISSKNNITYHGIDPEPRTYIGNVECAMFFKGIYEFSFKYDQGCAEDIMPNLNNEYDLIFTSPPFFDIEIYSQNKNQSNIKYKDYSEWKDRFLNVLIKESNRLLKDDKFLIINLKNNNRYNMYDDMVNISLNNGFELFKEYKIRLINNEFLRSKNNDINYHYEPIAVFKKKPSRI